MRRIQGKTDTYLPKPEVHPVKTGDKMAKKTGLNLKIRINP
jgi:hypothetical protein